MVRLSLRPWLVAIAAAVALLATQNALAAEQCVVEVASGLHQPAPVQSDDPEASDALIIEGEAVPISLSIGASAVAPRTIHAIGDAVIEAERACERAEIGSDGWFSRDDERRSPAPEVMLEAWLSTASPAIAPPLARLLSPRPAASMPLPGVRRELERPPRR